VIELGFGLHNVVSESVVVGDVKDQRNSAM